LPRSFFCFVFRAPAPTQLYTLSLHDALPISSAWRSAVGARYAIPSYDEVALEHWGESCRPVETLRALRCPWQPRTERTPAPNARDRKSTRLNSSHLGISYAVFCLKKKKTYNC